MINYFDLAQILSREASKEHDGFIWLEAMRAIAKYHGVQL